MQTRATDFHSAVALARGTGPTFAADILLLEANPLESISNTRRIRAVIKDGVVVR